ncbi:hypothetical protein [Rathayibacter sp. AY1A7]|uniref:hypothetical protein n=1 Tax=Rathayibacter sp. AY1A7 TaxID=2080524 RepID=UPI0011B0159E|nr:hypothetical protein [Rathayibacter sp. AY1A7]
MGAEQLNGSMSEADSSFGHVGGREAREGDRSGVTSRVWSEFDVLVEAIAIMTNWRKRSSYRCTATRQERGRIETYQLEFWPGQASYLCVDDRTGVTDSLNATTGRYIAAGDPRDLSTNQLMPEPLAARLGFPLNLPVWGRPNDAYRMVGATRADRETVIRLQHQADAHLLGTMTVDREKRLVTRLDTVTEVCRYENIEAGTRALTDL